LSSTSIVLLSSFGAIIFNGTEIIHHIAHSDESETFALVVIIVQSGVSFFDLIL